uniref:Uncharacterized protein n=1 Tax=Anguilla anguilla TaxID=7936 RepID=A0A0E9TWC8_ANGAN
MTLLPPLPFCFVCFCLLNKKNKNKKVDS